MNRINCENALMALMAEADGEETEFSPEQLNIHLAECDDCRREAEQMQSFSVLLKSQQRRAHDADLWRAIQPRLGEPENAGRVEWQPYLVLGVFLIGYKLLEMLPQTDLGMIFKIAPLIFAVALFVFLKENPFKINTELLAEK